MNSASAPLVCGAAMLVPWFMTCTRPGSSAEGDAHATAKSPEFTEAIAAPGAAISGFCRLSRVGPMLEKGEMLPGLTEPVKLMFGVPPQSVQKRLLVQDAVEMVFMPVLIALMSSAFESLPMTKLAARAVLLWKLRHRSTSPLAAPRATA